MSVKTFAAIDVGSYELSMNIYEFSGKSNMRCIDHVSRRLDLGSGTYATGKIHAEKMDELCRTLKEFSALMESYHVDAYRAYATSAIRETHNSTIVLDQIKQRTGLKLSILSNSEQRFLDYKSIASKRESFREIIEEKTAIVDIGGGSIQLSLFDKDTLVSTQNLRLGVLRVLEAMNHLHAGTAKLEQLADEMATAQLEAYKKLYLKDSDICNIIVVDDYISPWGMRQKSWSNIKGTLMQADLDGLIRMISTKNTSDIAGTLDMTEDRVPLALISAVLVRRIAVLMGAERIWTPGVSLCDGIAYEYGESLNMFQGEHDFEKDIVACAMNISKRYMGSKKRAETLETITTTIFDSMKKVHGMGRRELLYLRLAAILHDCGKYISLVNIGETSYNIIMATEIIGLSHREREIVASIVRFNHTPFVYYEQPGSSKTMDRDTYMIVAKLTAILRLASSMDRSHKQKLKGLKAQLRDNKLQMSVDTMEDITLEAESFSYSADFFQEVFSVTPLLQQRKSF